MNDYYNLENVLESLKKQILELQASKKRLESQIKDMLAQAEQEEQAIAGRVATARAQSEAEIEQLKAASAPYKELVQRCSAAKTALEKTQQAIQDETARLTDERRVTLTALNQQIERASSRLGKLHEEEAAFRQRIAMV